MYVWCMTTAYIQIGELEINPLTGISDQSRIIREIDSAIEAGATDIVFRISSFGGCAYQGFALYDRIDSLKIPTTAQIEGYCMSAATLVACACTKVVAGQASTFMIHDSWDFAIGNKEAMEISKKSLEHVDSKMARIYNLKTGMETKDLRKMMSANRESGTLLTAEKAHELGFVDEIMGSEQVAQAMQRIAAYYHQGRPQAKQQNTTKMNPLTKLINNVKAFTQGTPKAAAERKLQNSEDTIAIIGADEISEAAIGSPVGLYVAETMEFSNAPEGSHVLDDGATIEVDADGLLLGYTAGTGEEETEEASEDPAAQVDEAIQAATAPLQEQINAMAESINTLVLALGGDGKPDNAPKGKLPNTNASQTPKTLAQKRYEENQARVEKLTKQKTAK